MKRKLLSILLALVLLLPMLVFPTSASAAGTAGRWFSGQLTDQGKAIYNALVRMYDSGLMKDGRTSFDLAGSGVPGAADQYATVSQAAIADYRNGNRTLFNDFAAAKDAFDLEHPEAWYVDSSYLSFRVTVDDSGVLHAYMGAGRSDSYYVAGVTGAQDVDAKTAALEQVLHSIVTGARAVNTAGMNSAEAAAARVQYVHDAVTRGISYRYEIDAAPGNEGYIRTLYALVTHEGVCEAYSRAMQAILSRLGIPCVLIHGMQTAGDDPEPHMWNAVQIGGKWYAVDATWDDPIRLDVRGRIKAPEVPGLDGAEHDTYLLAGQDVIGLNWQPSGVVSTSGVEFRYPDIELRSYDGENVYSHPVGLHVSYSAAGEMEGEAAGVFTVDFNGMGMEKAAEECGVYLLIRMYDYHQDGTAHVMRDWYYCKASTAILGGRNEFFQDTDTCLRMVTPACEYVEYALTTTPPQGYETWNEEPTSGKNGLTNSNGETGFYHGDGTDIIAETGLLYNPQSSYEAPPYVKSQYPAANHQVHIGQTYRMQVLFDDELYAPDKAAARGGWTAPDKGAEGEAIRISYVTYQPDQNDDTIQVDLAGSVNFDTGHAGCVRNTQGGLTWRKHYVDSSLLEWHWVCTEDHIHTLGVCPVDGVSFDFAASTSWSDDLTLYSFQIEGLVGSRSGKRPNEWGVVMATPYCPICYRSQGIDWNLWGRPFLLDNPDDLDLSRVVVQGTDGSRQPLSTLDDRMNKNGYNGKLTLTVEDISKSRPRSEEVAEALEAEGVRQEDIVSKLMYEISFTRICKMMVLETGQSLRVSIGYPAGITYADLEKYVIKAYHFTRDEEGSCDITAPGHVHTGEITDVQELNISATPYGLVILCDSFSPFEIVALDARSAGHDAYELNKTVVVATDGNGEVLVNGKKAVGADGFIQFGSGVNSSHTFTLKPRAGYVLDTVAYGGSRHIDADKIAYDGRTGTYSFTLESGDIVDANDILNVTFIPASLKAAEERDGQTTVTPETCPHRNTSPIGPAKAPTCTAPGVTAGLRCNDCGQVLQPVETLPIVPHTVTGYRTIHKATCTEDGEAVGFCTACDWVDIRVLPAEGHNFANYRVVHPATCTEDGDEIGVCTKCGDWDLRAVPAKGHDYQNGVCARCGAKDLSQVDFPDVARGAWYYDDVQFACQNKLMSGTDRGFEPDIPATRGMVVTILWRMSGEPKASKSGSFTDVPAGQWFTDAVNWASANKIADGSGNRFDPNGPVTREQLVTFLYRYVKYRGKSADAGATALKGFSDAGLVDLWALEPTRWAVENGILNGSDGKLEPAGSATRAQIAAMIHRMCDKYDLL